MCRGWRLRLRAVAGLGRINTRLEAAEAEAGMREPSGGGTTARHSLEMELRWSHRTLLHYYNTTLAEILCTTVNVDDIINISKIVALNMIL